MLVGRGQHGTQSVAQQVPGAFFLFGIIMMQVVPPHPGPGQYMILTAIDDVQAALQGLHHGRACAAQVMRRPVTVLAVGKDQRVVMAPPGEGLTIFEPGLTVADLFAHHSHVDMPSATSWMTYAMVVSSTANSRSGRVWMSGMTSGRNTRVLDETSGGGRYDFRQVEDFTVGTLR